MRNPRIYQDQHFTVGQVQPLSDDAFGHTVRVLRLKEGDLITLFNGFAEKTTNKTAILNIRQNFATLVKSVLISKY